MGFYFASVLRHASSQVEATDIVAFIGMVGALVIVQIIGHTLLGIASRKELLEAGVQTDERDAWVRLKGAQLVLYRLS